MAWLLVSLLGLLIMVLNIRYHYKETEDSNSKGKQWFVTLFFLLISVGSQASLLYLGLLLVLFGLVMATGLL
ncbi:hypothetical protein IMZ08_05805 [Bacillus luteolus]|uniref:Uncharacterized protein n=1 Tax=Litchfieldia luteola TaxID=682179 RepID=A0ABR9QGF7_9BACI|nr:hypothetical protein [Cytobacillus luteolus]MBE4907578.1 hypothetical protein [Cytobacillus luteolus]MBP1944352.1 hypothetical protein [Cytobacillus luteolus]